MNANLVAGALVPVLLAALLLGAAVGGSVLKPEARRRIEHGLKVLYWMGAGALSVEAALAIYRLVRSGRWSVNWWEFTAAAGTVLIIQVGAYLGRRNSPKQS